MTWNVGTSNALRCALSALKKEILGFRFDYPLQIVPEGAEKGSLHYHLYGDALSWEALRLSPKGVPRAWYRSTGAVYWPGYIAWYGLVQLGHYLRGGDPENLRAFETQVNWLERNATVRGDGAVVWAMNFDYPCGLVTLKAPWISAYTQGLVISALVRAWRMTKRPELMGLLQNSAHVFGVQVKDSGVRVLLDGRALYTEVPGGPPPGILDGFMTSLLGLYDLHVETGDATVGRYFEEGIEGLKYSLPRWDYRTKWSWYGNRAYLSPPAYHYQNRLLLEILGRLTNEPLLSQYAQVWNPDRLSAVERSEIYVGFVLTKNRNRWRYRTWRRTKDRIEAASRLPVKTPIAQPAVSESQQ
jgi:hypothetical protein